MEYKLNKLENSERSIDITFTLPEIKKYEDKVMKELQTKVDLKGFRKGKVPPAMLKKMYGQQIEADAIEEAINCYFGEIIETAEIKMVSQPILNTIDKKEDGSILAVLTYETEPEFDLCEYKGLNIVEYTHVVADEEIEDRVNQICIDRGKAEKCEEGKSIDSDMYIAVCEFTNKNAEVEAPFNTTAYLFNPQIDPVLKSLLLNTKVGDAFDFQKEVPEKGMQDYSVKVLDLFLVVPAELNEEFIKTLTDGKFESVEDYKEEIGYALQEDWDAHTRESLLKQINDKLVELHDFTVPTRFFEKFVQASVDDLKAKNPKDPNIQKLTAKELDAQTLETLQYLAKLTIVKNRIIEKKNLI